MSIRFKEDKNKDKEIADDEIVKMTKYVESKKLKIVNTSNTKNHIKNYKRLNKTVSKLTNAKDFPCTRLSRRVLINRRKLLKWLEENKSIVYEK